MANWKGIEYSGTLAHVIEETPDQELAFYDYIDDLSDQIFEAMESKGWSKADLARATGKSRSWVTQVLSGENNMTMKTFVSILHALGMKAETKIVNDKECSWNGISSDFEYLNLKSKQDSLARVQAPYKEVGLRRGKILKYAKAA
nr:helix-turn-helix transcriptional regulator [uncultured Pseudodesulfovibrio sp.]